jgi:hypothetical protein
MSNASSVVSYETSGCGCAAMTPLWRSPFLFFCLCAFWAARGLSWLQERDCTLCGTHLEHRLPHSLEVVVILLAQRLVWLQPHGLVQLLQPLDAVLLRTRLGATSLSLVLPRA